MKKTEIAKLQKTLEDAGFESVKLEQKDRGIYWLGTKQGFRISEKEDGTVININDFEILVNNFHSLLPAIENKTLKSLLLKPINT